MALGTIVNKEEEIINGRETNRRCQNMREGEDGWKVKGGGETRR